MTSLEIAQTHKMPLCVDLDGTLICADTLHESALRLLRRNPQAFAAALLTLLLHGIAAFKRAVSAHVALRPDLLPYNKELVAYLTQQAAEGRRVLLVTAADKLVAERIATHLGIFDAVLASDASTNLKSHEKMYEIVRYLNGECFEYAGNSRSDISVWKAASAAILVNPTRSIRKAVTRSGVRITREFRDGGPTSKLRAYFRAMRIYQWAKNVLIFLPLLLSHTILDLDKLLMAVTAFWIFSAAASAVYVINDLLDLDSDRRHPRKRRRPFAAGTLTIKNGIALAIALFGVSGVVSLVLSPPARVLLFVYVITTFLYSLRLKTCLFLDIITLAGLYTLRVIFGGLVTGVVISPWTLAFSIFFFGFLATCKRLSELRSIGAKDANLSLPGRAYSSPDLLALTPLACSSGYVAVLVLALYLNSPEVIPLYRHSMFLWFLLPVLTYWIGRTVMIANRGEIHDDPIVYAFRDPSSIIAGLLALAAILRAL